MTSSTLGCYLSLCQWLWRESIDDLVYSGLLLIYVSVVVEGKH